MRVFLDPGHGGSDPGASGNGITEKAKNLEVALKLRALLLAAGFDVILSRETDKTVELQQRTDYANAWPADVLLSIHHNAGGGRGIETYHSAYAAKHQADGKRLGQAVHGALIKEFAEMTNRGTKTRTFQQSPVDYYHMIREARVPSIITETGFVDNAQDAAIINAAAFADRQARALFAGVQEYFGVTGTTKEGRKRGPMNFILINTDDDYVAAKRVLRTLTGHGSIVLRESSNILRETQEQDRLIVMGGNVDGIDTGKAKVELWSGDTWWLTMQNAGRKIGVL